MRQRILRGQISSFHTLRVRRHVDRLRHELVPRVREQCRPRCRPRRVSTLSRNRQRATCQPPRLPAAAARQRVRGEAACRRRRRSRRPRAIVAGVDAGLARGELERELGVELAERAPRSSRRSARQLGVLGVAGTPPSSTSGARTRGRSGPVAMRSLRDRQEDRRLGARLRRQPVVGLRRGVRQARVEHDQLRAVLPAPR